MSLHCRRRHALGSGARAPVAARLQHAGPAARAAERFSQAAIVEALKTFTRVRPTCFPAVQRKACETGADAIIAPRASRRSEGRARPAITSIWSPLCTAENPAAAGTAYKIPKIPREIENALNAFASPRISAHDEHLDGVGEAINKKPSAWSSKRESGSKRSGKPSCEPHPFPSARHKHSRQATWKPPRKSAPMASNAITSPIVPT